jgi:hypothetical protein
MKNILTTLFVCSFGLFVMGQGTQDPIYVTTTSVRTVEPAFRKTEYPKVIDTIIPTPSIEYPLLVLQHKTSIQLEEIKAANVKMTDKLNPLYKSYIKAGIGSKLMPLGEFYFSNTRSRKYTYGAHLKHLSSLADIKGYAPATYDRSYGSLYGSILEKYYTLKGDLHYGNQGFHYYGVPNELLDRDSISQRYNDIGGSVTYSSHKKDSANLNYSIGLDYNNFFSKKPITDSLSKWKAMENYVAINTKGTYKMGDELFAADFNIRYNGYKYGVVDSTINPLDSGIALNNTVVNLKPTITTFLKDNKFKAQIGVDLTLDVHNKTKFYIYPIAEVKYAMFNDILIPYTGLNGGLKQNTFKSITQTNEFILPNVRLQNEHNAMNFYLGMKGTLSKRIGFNIKAQFSHSKNKALFVSDTTYPIFANQPAGGRFDLIYDTVNTASIEGSLSYQLREKIKIDAMGRYNSYSLLNNTYAWNLPILEVVVRGKYNLYDHFIINLDFSLEGGRKALVYTPEEDVTEENNQYAKTLGTITDINLGLEYRYNTRISAFIQGNNLVGQRYKRWYNTPVQGIQVMGGVTFRF